MTPLQEAKERIGTNNAIEGTVVFNTPEEADRFYNCLPYSARSMRMGTTAMFDPETKKAAISTLRLLITFERRGVVKEVKHLDIYKVTHV